MRKTKRVTEQKGFPFYRKNARQPVFYRVKRLHWRGEIRNKKSSTMPLRRSARKTNPYAKQFCLASCVLKFPCLNRSAPLRVRRLFGLAELRRFALWRHHHAIRSDPHMEWHGTGRPANRGRRVILHGRGELRQLCADNFGHTVRLDRQASARSN